MGEDAAHAKLDLAATGPKSQRHVTRKALAPTAATILLAIGVVISLHALLGPIAKHPPALVAFADFSARVDTIAYWSTGFFALFSAWLWFGERLVGQPYPEGYALPQVLLIGLCLAVLVWAMAHSGTTLGGISDWESFWSRIKEILRLLIFASLAILVLFSLGVWVIASIILQVAFKEATNNESSDEPDQN